MAGSDRDGTSRRLAHHGDDHVRARRRTAPLGAASPASAQIAGAPRRLHGQEMSPAAMETLIRSIGREPWQRTTLYDAAACERVATSFAAPPLAPMLNSPPTAAHAAREHAALPLQ